jgi:hypothetical protein
MKEYYFDEKNYMNHFRQAFKTGLFKENEPYMYMEHEQQKNKTNNNKRTSS